MKKLFTRQDGKYYFPSLLGCAVLTSILRPLINGISQQQRSASPALDFLKSKSQGQEFIALKVEKLDLNFGLFIRQIVSQSSEGLTFFNKLKLAKNIITGLKLINRNHLHCDIKPDNLMIKKVRKNDYDNEKLLIETTAGEFFLIKYIDFGLSVPKKARCPGGTFGYAAPELFDKRFGHEKFDVFSLGVLLIDTELLGVGITEGLASIFRETHQYKFEKKSELDDSIKEKLLSFKIVRLVNDYFSTYEGRWLLKMRLESTNKLVKKKINSDIPNIFGLKDDKSPGFLDHTVEYFEFVLCQMIRIYLVEFYPKVNSSLQQLNLVIAEYQQEFLKIRQTFKRFNLESFLAYFRMHSPLLGLKIRAYKSFYGQSQISRLVLQIAKRVKKLPIPDPAKKQIMSHLVKQFLLNNMIFLENIKSHLWKKYLVSLTNMIRWIPQIRISLDLSLEVLTNLKRNYILKLEKLYKIQKNIEKRFGIRVKLKASIKGLIFDNLKTKILSTFDLENRDLNTEVVSQSFILENKGELNYI